MPKSLKQHQPPDLLFGEHFKRLLGATPTCFKSLKRVNIVHHSSVRVSPDPDVSQINAATVFRARTSVFRACSPTAIPTIKQLASVNLEVTKGKHSHYRIRSSSGKFLLFGTGNIILAGRRNHGRSCACSTKMIRLMSTALQRPVMPVSYQTPNCVLQGDLAFKINPDIKKNQLVSNSSNKFPGIALLISEPHCTPELYLRRSIIILPGITTAEQLLRVVAEIDELLKPYRLPD